jgi:hypothetical protein
MQDTSAHRAIIVLLNDFRGVGSNHAGFPHVQLYGAVLEARREVR